jgi:aminopeptidase
MEDPRIRKFAKFLINYAVKLEKGEKILIEIHGKEVPLARALIEEAYLVGGKPYIHTFDYKLERALLNGADEKHMEEIAAYEISRMKNMDAYIDVRATENLSEWNDVSDGKINIYRSKYWGPLHLDLRCNHTKWSVLRYPNDAMAQLAKMSTEEYEDFYFKACLLDYDKMAAAMENLVKLMDKTEMVRITGPDTDISFSIKGIPSIPLAGHKNLPDGEVYTAPVKNSVNGKIAFNTPSVYEGCIYTDVKLEFKDGKIIKIEANDPEKINKIFNFDEGSKYVGEFALGVNPIIKHPIGDILFDEKIAGSFHLTPGQCYDNASNGNKSAIHWDLISIQREDYGGGEIYFDGVRIRKNGVFILEELKCLNSENLL